MNHLDLQIEMVKSRNKCMDNYWKSGTIIKFHVAGLNFLEIKALIVAQNSKTQTKVLTHFRTLTLQAT